MKYRIERVLMGLVFLSVCFAPVLAAPTDDPQYQTCDLIYTGDQHNDRIDCKAENVTSRLYDYVDTVIEFERSRRAYGREPILTDLQMKHLDQAKERAKKSKDRSHDALGFAASVRKQQSRERDCFIKEFQGDDDGICEKGEVCQELHGDGIGNDDNICMTKGNPKLREVCEEICQTGAADEEPYDPGVAFDTEQGLVELDAALFEATDEIQRAMRRMHDYYASRPAESPTGECEAFEFDLFPQWYALQASQAAKNIAEAVFNSCSAACQQDAFGWNCHAACLVFALITSALNTVDDAFTVIDGGNGSTQLDRVAKCARQMNTEIGDLSVTVNENGDAIGDIDGKLDALADQIQALSKQIEALTTFVDARFIVVEDHLCTPQGLRVCFPDGVNRSADSLTEIREAPVPRTNVRKDPGRR